MGRPQRPRVSKTNKIKPSDNSLEVSIFSSLEAKESQYYLHLLSFKPFNKYFVTKLQTFLLEEDSKAAEKLLESLNKKSQDLSFRLLDGPKLWGRMINQLLLGKITDSDDFSAYCEAEDSNKFEVWFNKSIALYEEITSIKNKFATANMGLVVATVKNIINSRNISISYEDLIQEGYFGLVRAIDKFDYTKGLKFSTYSVWWIRHAAQRYIQDRDVLIRVPAHADGIRNKVKEFKQTFQEKFDRLPSDDEVSIGTGLTNLSMATVVEPYKMVSIDQEIYSEDEDNCLQLEDTSEDIFQELATKNDIDKLLFILNSLSAVEKKIIYDRYGFVGEEMTLAEVGKQFNLSRERVRQIQEKTLSKIRETFLIQEPS